MLGRALGKSRPSCLPPVPCGAWTVIGVSALPGYKKVKLVARRALWYIGVS